MTKGDFPALRMIVDGGRLVPAGQFDAERLASYRRGAVVMCRFTEEKDRVLVRKWFAIIGLVLKTCNTPWKNKDEAHEAIKLALGIVNLSKTVGGQFMQYPKSLADLDDPEMTDALEQMTALLSRMTGVDVETLEKETAHVAPDPEPETDNTNSGEAPLPEPDTADDTSTLADQAADGEGETTASPSAAALTDVQRASMIECCRKMLAIPAQTDLDQSQKLIVLAEAKDDWKSMTKPAVHENIKCFYESAKAQIKADPRVYPNLRAKAFDLFSEVLDCEAKKLGA